MQLNTHARTWLLALGSAACFALAFPPFGPWWLAVAAISGWVMLAARETLTRGAWFAITVSALLMWLWFQLWVIDVALVGYPFMCIYLALYTPLFVWALRQSARGTIGAYVPWAVRAPIVLVALEWIRGVIVFDGYPWYAAGHPLIDCAPLAQVADFGGTPAASFLVASLGGAVVDVFCWRAQRAVPSHASRTSLAGVFVAIALLVGSLGYGSMRLAETEQCLTAGPRILAVQTNLTTDNKIGWPRDRQESDVAAFGALTLSLAESARANGDAIDLIVWPETMLPGFGLEPETISMMSAGGWWPGSRFSDFVHSIARNVGAPFLVGSPAYLGLRAQNERWVWNQQFNSAYLLEPAGTQQRYDKVFLTPFGETMPYISNWSWLEEQLLALGARGMTFDLDASTDLRTLAFHWGAANDATKQIELATPICFEDTVAPVVRKLVYRADGSKRAAIIVNLSNDGWFGFSDAGRAQHALMARWRCIENRVPMVRVANTGISAAFTSEGAPVAGASVAPRTAGGFATTTKLDSRETLFGRLGDVGSPLMLLATIILCGKWKRCSLCALLLLAGCTGNPSSVASIDGGSWSSRPRTIDPSMSLRTVEPVEETVVVVPTETVVVEAAAVEPPVADPTLGKVEQPAPAPALAPAATEVVAVESAATVAVVAPAETAQQLMREGKSPSELALDILVAASSSQEAIYRAHALEGLQPATAALESATFRLLADPNPGVRFAAAVTVGRNRFVQCAQVVEPLTLDPNLSVRAAALYALVRLGRVVDITPLAQLMMSEDADVRSNAFFVLGELRNPSAIPLVETAVGRPLIGADRTRARIVDLQAAEAMAKMGDYRQFDPIRAALFAPSDQSEIVALACQIVGEINDRGARGHLIGIWNGKEQLQKPLEIRLIVGTALIRIGEPNVQPILQLCETAIKDPSPSVRAQASATLGWVGGPRALALLSQTLADPVPIVRLTAAAGYLRAMPESQSNSAGG